MKPRPYEIRWCPAGETEWKSRLIEAQSWAVAWETGLGLIEPGDKLFIPQYYYLVQLPGKDQRVVSELDIPTFTGGFKTLKGPTTAKSWLAARIAFGLPMTEIQKRLLEQQQRLLP